MAGTSMLDWTGGWFKFQFLVSTPGYYKTNRRALRLREMVRWHGWSRGTRVWLKTRFMPMSRTGSWMPGLWAENECKPDDLSPDFWQATKPHRADFGKLGFAQCHLTKQTKTLNPQIRESGSIFYLDATRCYFGQLIYSQHYLAARNTEVNNIIIAFTAVFENGSLSCTNHRLAFDSPEAREVIRLNSYDVPVIYSRFREELQRRTGTPQPFADIEALRKWFNARQIGDFEDRVRRRLFIPMTEPEIAAAQTALQRSQSAPPPLPRRRFRLEYWPTAIVFLLLLLIINWRQHAQMPGNTLDYRGQKFKMRLPYDSFEDYKDDPNNLDTHELDRIEQTMESAKIPASFKDRKAFFDFIVFDMEFPGYGLSSLGSTNTDDGSVLDMESVEIPQADKDRIVVVRESGGNLKLVDDFIHDNSGTNDVGRVDLKHDQLQYFDETGKMFRKKSL